MNLSKKEQIFKFNYDKWAQAIFRFIYFKSKDKHLSQDIVQDTFVKYWDKIDTITVGKEKSYLYTTAKNLFLNNIEHKKVILKHHQTKPKKDSSTTPLFELEVSEFKKRLEQAIDNLPDKQREVFLMNRIEGYKYKEIAQILNLSQKAVEKRMSQALQELRTICVKI